MIMGGSSKYVLAGKQVGKGDLFADGKAEFQLVQI